MKPISMILAVVLVTGAGVLTACGGGEDEAGSLTAFSIVPSELTLTSGGATCDPEPASSEGSRVYIYGGAAPYKLDNTFPDQVALSTNEVADRGGYFIVKFKGGCIDPGTVIVTDQNNRQVKLTLTHAPGG